MNPPGEGPNKVIFTTGLELAKCCDTRDCVHMNIPELIGKVPVCPLLLNVNLAIEVFIEPPFELEV